MVAIVGLLVCVFWENDLVRFCDYDKFFLGSNPDKNLILNTVLFLFFFTRKHYKNPQITGKKSFNIPVKKSHLIIHNQIFLVSINTELITVRLISYED
jgi:hypothetical protein